MKNSISIIAIGLSLALSLSAMGQQAASTATPPPELAFPKAPAPASIPAKAPAPASAPGNASPDGFKPLNRLRTQSNPSNTTVYVVGQPRGQFLGSGMTPNYVIANGRVIPYTNLTKNASSSKSGVPNRSGLKGNSLLSNTTPHLSVEQQKEFQKSLVAFTDLKKTDPEKVMHVEMLIGAANKDPEVQKKLDEIRRFVHDYISKHSPADLKTLEIMTKPKQILEHNGVPGNLVY